MSDHEHEWDFTEPPGPGNPVRNDAIYPVRCQCGATARIRVEMPPFMTASHGMALHEIDLQEPT